MQTLTISTAAVMTGVSATFTATTPRSPARMTSIIIIRKKSAPMRRSMPMCWAVLSPKPAAMTPKATKENIKNTTPAARPGRRPQAKAASAEKSRAPLFLRRRHTPHTSRAVSREQMMTPDAPARPKAPKYIMTSCPEAKPAPMREPRNDDAICTEEIISFFIPLLICAFS